MKCSRWQKEYGRETHDFEETESAPSPSIGVGRALNIVLEESRRFPLVSATDRPGQTTDRSICFSRRVCRSPRAVQPGGRRLEHPQLRPHGRLQATSNPAPDRRLGRTKPQNPGLGWPGQCQTRSVKGTGRPRVLGAALKWGLCEAPGSGRAGRKAERRMAGRDCGGYVGRAPGDCTGLAGAVVCESAQMVRKSAFNSGCRLKFEAKVL